MPAFDDLTGRIFDYLTVLSQIKKPPNIKSPYWSCRCVCGKLVKRASPSLKDKKRVCSCGCKKKSVIEADELIGKEFNMLRVIKRSEKQTYNSVVYFDCECKCGKTVSLRSTTIRDGKRLSCGCKRTGPKSGKKNSKFRGYGDISKTFWGTIERGAKDRCLKFIINIKFGWELFLKQKRKCALTGVDLFFGNAKNPGDASLDRIDSSKGYLPDNIQWIHKDLNRIKLNLKLDDFIEWCCKVADFHRKSNNSKELCNGE